MSTDAKPLTTAEVEGWRYALGQHWAAKIGPLGHEVVIEGDRISATTRALESARARVEELMAWVKQHNPEWLEKKS